MNDEHSIPVVTFDTVVNWTLRSLAGDGESVYAISTAAAWTSCHKQVALVKFCS